MTSETGRISRRIAAIAESATLAVDAKAKALKAAGEPVIGFGAGEPDFPTPTAIVEAAVVACRDERNHRYSPTGGLPELRAGIAEKTKRDSGYDVVPVVLQDADDGTVVDSYLRPQDASARAVADGISAIHTPTQTGTDV